jgi:hypothetical protein
MNRTRAPPREAQVRHAPPRAGRRFVSRATRRTAINHMTQRLTMSKATLSRLTVLCAALSACSDTNTNRTMTAPNARPALSEASTDISVSYTLDGPFDVAVATQDAFAQMAAAPQAASGSRASGHVGFPSGVPGAGITFEKYSFVALSTDPATPLAAKGQYEVALTTAAGVTQTIHGDVVCMNTFGNTTRVGGQITKVWRNGVQVPITANTHAIWVVVDNGEGAATPDQVSLMRFGNAAAAQTYCATGFLSVVFPNQEGNVQVQP